MASKALGVIILTFLRVVAWAYAVQPAFLRRLYGESLGLLLHTFGLRAEIIRQNLGLAFPTNAPAQYRLFKNAYDHLGHLVFEVLLVLGPMKRYATKNSELRGIEYWRTAKKAGKGVIFVSSHVGNWEIMLAAGGLAGIDVLMVTKQLKPQWLHNAIEQGRFKCSIRGAYEPRTLKDVLKHLGQGGTVGIVLDQYTGPPVGVRVPFFGVPVGTSTLVAALAKRTGAVVLPVVNYRTPNHKFVVDIRQPLEWISDSNSSSELALNTANYVSILEKDIRSHPEQWLWIHRRFKGDLSPLRSGEWESGRARK